MQHKDRQMHSPYWNTDSPFLPNTPSFPALTLASYIASSGFFANLEEIGVGKPERCFILYSMIDLDTQKLYKA